MVNCLLTFSSFTSASSAALVFNICSVASTSVVLRFEDAVRFECAVSDASSISSSLLLLLDSVDVASRRCSPITSSSRTASSSCLDGTDLLETDTGRRPGGPTTLGDCGGDKIFSPSLNLTVGTSSSTFVNVTTASSIGVVSATDDVFKSM